MLKIIQSWFAEVGINMEIQTMDQVTFTNRHTNRNTIRWSIISTAGHWGWWTSRSITCSVSKRGFKANSPSGQWSCIWCLLCESHCGNIRGSKLKKSNEGCERACGPATLQHIPGAAPIFSVLRNQMVERVYRTIRGAGFNHQSIALVLSGEILDW